MDFAEGPFFLEAVDDEGADAECGGVLGFGVEGGLRWGVRDFACGAEGDGVDLGGLGVGGDREEEQQEHSSRAVGWHAEERSRGARGLL